MGCADLHINVQDASGDRILAGETLRKDPTNWNQWVNAQGVHLLDHLSVTQQQELERDTHPGHVLNEVRRTKRKFRRTPRGGRGSCRIFGSLAGNKVQGDFHITARGHGYMEFGDHLDHQSKFLNEYFFLSFLLSIFFFCFSLYEIIILLPSVPPSQPPVYFSRAFFSFSLSPM